MKYVIIFSLLLFNILLVSVAMKFHPKENHPCPGVFEKLKELVAAGDDLDAVAQAMEGCRRGFSEEANMILSIMVQLDRHRSFRYLFNLSALNSQVNVPDFRQLWFRGYKFGFFLEALIAHRPKICKYLLSTTHPDFWKKEIGNFWRVKPYRWALEELLNLTPPVSIDAIEMMAPADVLRNCNSMEECMLPLAFNTHVARKNDKFKNDKSPFYDMLDALLKNRVLGDEEMAVLIDQLLENDLTVADWRMREFLMAHADYPLSRQALLTASPEDSFCIEFGTYPDDVLEDLCRLSFEQAERLQRIVAEGDSPGEFAVVLGYCYLALGHRVLDVFGQMVEHNRVESFSWLLSSVDFEHLSRGDEAILAMIHDSHRQKRREIFEHMAKSAKFSPERFMTAMETDERLKHMNAADLSDFLGLFEDMVAVNGKLDACRIFSGIAANVLRNRRMRDEDMTAVLSHLWDLGATFDENAVEVLQKNHPAYEWTRQFVIDRLPDVKEPVD